MIQAANRIIQSLWLGNELSLMEQLSINSFLSNGHEYHLYIYDDVKNIPEGTTVKNANEILPAKRIFTYSVGWGKGSYAGFADLFRYHLLKIKGGWWVDTDIVCLKPFDFESEYVIASSYERQQGEAANNCVLKIPKDSYLAAYLVEVSDKAEPNTLKFAETGPVLIQKAVSELNYQQHVVSHEIFCPITWRAVNKIVYNQELLTFQKAFELAKDWIKPIIIPDTKSGMITKNSYAVHLWNEIWRQNNLDKNATYNTTCLYERLKRQYLYSNPN
ncbi:MAG: glycosyltransferase [Nostoc sp.]|uniref:glycosyltransferase n=1 Tax=Nostoc sp. TaxID=1180 RepID=UPI002FFB4428